MSRKFVSKIIAGAAFGTASLLVAAPGMALADDHDRDHKKPDSGWVYSYPDHAKPGETVHIVQICKDPVEKPAVWSKLTGKVKLSPGTDLDKLHSKKKKKDGKLLELEPAEGADDTSGGQNAEADEMADSQAGTGNGGTAGGLDTGPASDERNHDDKDKKGERHDGKKDERHDDKGHKRDHHDDKDKKGEHHDDKDHKGKKGERHDGKDHKGKHHDDKGKGKDHKGKKHHDEHPWAYSAEVKVPRDAEPGRYLFKGDCGEGKLVVVPAGWVDGGDGGVTESANAGMIAGGAGALAVAALGGTALLRRRTTDGSLV